MLESERDDEGTDDLQQKQSLIKLTLLQTLQLH